MRVLMGYVLGEEIDGTERQVRYLADYLRAAGHHVDAITNRRGPISSSRMRRTSAVFRMLFESARAGRYDIVHAHHPMAASVLVGAQGGRRILTMHRRHLPWLEFVEGKPAGGPARRHERKAVRAAEVVTAVDEDTAAYYRGLTDRPVHVIPSGIDAASLPDGSRRLAGRQAIYAGRLSPEKGIRDLIAAARSLPGDTHLVIVGSGPEEPAVREAAEMPNVHYLGRLPPAETVEWIRGSDILVEPSLMTSGIPLTVLEAMACNTAVVARDTPAIRGSAGGGAAHLFTDRSAIAGTICRLLDDRPRMDVMTARARMVARSHSFEVIGRRYLDLYQGVLDSSGA